MYIYYDCYLFKNIHVYGQRIEMTAVLGIFFIFLNTLRFYNIVFTIKNDDRVGSRERKPILLHKGYDIIAIFKFTLNFKSAFGFIDT